MKKTRNFLTAALIAGATLITPLSADAFWGFPFGNWGPWDDWGYPGYGYPGYGYGYPGYGYPAYGYGYPAYGYGYPAYGYGYPAYTAPQAAVPATESK